MKNKITVKEQLKQANETIDRMFFANLALITGKRAFELMLAGMNEDLFDLDKDIENEKAFIKDSPGKDNREYLKKLKVLRKDQMKLISSFEKFIEQRNKVDKFMREIL